MARLQNNNFTISITLTRGDTVISCQVMKGKHLLFFVTLESTY